MTETTPAAEHFLTEAQMEEWRLALAGIRATAPALAAWCVTYRQAWTNAVKEVAPMVAAHLKARP